MLLWSAQHHQAVLAQGPAWSVGRDGVHRPSPGNSGGSAQEGEQAQRWFLLWALFPFLKVHACPSELLSFFLCLWLPNYCVIETPTIFQAFTVSHVTDLLPDF